MTFGGLRFGLENFQRFVPGPGSSVAVLNYRLLFAQNDSGAQMAEIFEPDDRVEWNSEAGRVRGES